MTMQVGLVGRAGIILASDLRITTSVSMKEEQEDNVAYLGRHGRKIEFDKDRNIAVSCADDLDFARSVAKRIIAELTPSDMVDEGSATSAIERIVNDASSTGNKKAQWLIALRCPDWQLFKCRLAPLDPEKINGEWEISCAPSFTGREIAGHVVNPAIFLTKFHDEFLLAERLIPLAAHLVLSAHYFNSDGIEGLEIVQCDASGVRRIAAASIADLKKASRDLDMYICESLTGCERAYAYDSCSALS